MAQQTLALSMIGTLFPGESVIWTDSPAINGVFFSDGAPRNLGSIQFQPTGIFIDIDGGAYDLTSAFETGGEMLWTASNGATLTTIGINDPTEPYVWAPSNFAEYEAFLNILIGLSNQSITLRLDDSPGAGPPIPAPGANTVSNTAAVTFPTPTSAWAQPTHFGYRTAANGGTWIGGDALSAAVAAPQAGATVQFPANALVVELPPGEWEAGGVAKGLVGFISGTLYVTLHSGNPGADGANELAGGGYQRVAIPANAWTAN